MSDSDEIRQDSRRGETIRAALQCVAVLLVVDLVASACVSLFARQRVESFHSIALLLAVVAPVGNIAAIAFAFTRGFRWPELRALGQQPWSDTGLFALGCTSLAVFASIGAALVTGSAVRTGPVPTSVAWELTSDQLVRGVISVTVGPVVEELIFRGVVLKTLIRRLPSVAAVLTSAVIFAAYHLSPTHFPYVFVLGVVTGYGYYRARSVVPCIIGHSAWNAVATIEAGFVGDSSWSVPLVAGSILALALSVYSFRQLSVSGGAATGS